MDLTPPVAAVLWLDRYSRQAANSCSAAGVLRKMSTAAVAQAVDDDMEGSSTVFCSISRVQLACPLQTGAQPLAPAAACCHGIDMDSHTSAQCAHARRHMHALLRHVTRSAVSAACQRGCFHRPYLGRVRHHQWNPARGRTAAPPAAGSRRRQPRLPPVPITKAPQRFSATTEDAPSSLP